MAAETVKIGSQSFLLLLTLPLSRWTIQMTSKASDWVIIMLHFKYIRRNGTIPKDTFHLVARRILLLDDFEKILR